MTVTLTSLLSCLTSSALLTVLAWVMVKNNSVLRIAGKYLYIFLSVIVMRILFPIEFGFVTMLFDRNIQKMLEEFLFRGISVGTYDITVGGVLLFLWISGMVYMFSIHAGRYFRFVHMIGKCPGYFKHDTEAVINRINREYGKKTEFQVLLLPSIQAPAIFGMMHPKILMPMADYTELEIYYILKHEMLHYYHHDMLVKILCEMLCAVYWWNPAVYLLRKLVVRILEIRVDCALTSGFGKEEKIKYLECILKSMKEGRQDKTNLMITFAAQKGDTMKQRFHCIWENQQQGKEPKRTNSIGGKIMRKTIALKTLLRSPVKTILTFLLIASASFALFSRVTDYAVTTRETKNAESLYHAVASLDNEVPDIPIEIKYVNSADGTVSTGYSTIYEMEDKPWLTKEQLEEFSSLPGVTVADHRYATAGRVEDYKRLLGSGDYGGFFVFEGTYRGYIDDSDPSVLEDHVKLKFDDVKVIAAEEGPEIDTSFTMNGSPLGDTYYAKSSYTRAFYDSLKIGCRCLVLAENTGYSYESDENSGIYFRPHAIGEGALRVIDGQPDNYLETESFALQKGWVDAINHNLSVYDVIYTSDMRAISSFNKQRCNIVKGRYLTKEDAGADVCVVSEEFLEAHGLSVGDSINIQLGDKIGCTTAYGETKDWWTYLDSEKIPNYATSAELTIIGAYAEGEGEIYTQPNNIYVPVTLLPVEVPDDSEYFPALFVENAQDIEAFHEAVEEFAQKVGLTLSYSDRGWLDVKDSFQMGALSSLLTTVLYVAGAVLALFLAVYLYIGRNRKSYAIMRTLGVPSKAAGNSVVLPFVTVSALAVSIGGIVGLYYAQNAANQTLTRMADSAPEGYMPDATLPVSVVVLCLLSEILFVSLTAYVFLRKMKKTPPLELLQEGTMRSLAGSKAELATEELSVPVKLDMAKLSAAKEWVPQGNYGPIRHVSAYIWRHMRRGIGKTTVSLILAVVLAAGIGTLVLARLTYQDAFYDLGVKGNAVDFTFKSVVDLSKSPLIEDFYCYDSFGVRIEGFKDNVPMTITNDPVRNMENNCTVDFAEGFDFSAFDGTAQLCLVGKDLAEKLGISPGDEIGILTDLLYSMLKESRSEKEVKGYKEYMVIGVAESEDKSVRNSIYTGIRSDLTLLFSMDFAVEHCEFTLADNERFGELEEILKKKKDSSAMYSSGASYHLDTGGLTNIERIRGLLESLFPIAVTAASLIGVFGPLLVILQSAQEAAFLRILGVTKKRARCMLVFEQIVLCTAGIILVAGGFILYSPGLFARSIETLVLCWMLYLLGCICGASAASVQVTRHRILELLQVRE